MDANGSTNFYIRFQYFLFLQQKLHILVFFRFEWNVTFVSAREGMFYAFCCFFQSSVHPKECNLGRTFCSHSLQTEDTIFRKLEFSILLTTRKFFHQLGQNYVLVVPHIYDWWTLGRLSDPRSSISFVR